MKHIMVEALLIGALLGLLGINIVQARTVAQQTQLIRAMERNPYCMVDK
jgi:hypothetical protein